MKISIWNARDHLLFYCVGGISYNIPPRQRRVRYLPCSFLNKRTVTIVASIILSVYTQNIYRGVVHGI